MRSDESEVDSLVVEDASEGCQGEGSVADAGVCGQDAGSGGEVDPVRRRKGRYATRHNPRQSFASFIRGGAGDLRQGVGQNRGYWGQREIGAALGVRSWRTLSDWHKYLGLPVWERWNRRSGRWMWWSDDSMLLAWKLKMAQRTHAQYYGVKKPT